MEKKNEKRNTPEQIVRELGAADAPLSEGPWVADGCIRFEGSDSTYLRWRRHYSGVELQALKWLKTLERKNSRLWVIVAEQAMDQRILKEVFEGIF